MYQFLFDLFAAPRRPRRRSLFGISTRWSFRGVSELEARVLLSGNVTAQIGNGIARIDGDAESNQILFEAVDGHLVLTGLQGTTINGQTTFTLNDAATTFDGRLDIRLGNAADSVAFSDGITITGNVVIIDRDGANTLGFRGVTLGGSLRVTTGSAADTVTFEEMDIAGKLTVSTDGGADTVSMLTTAAQGRTKLSTGTGADSIIVDDSQFGETLRFNTLSGADNVLFRQTTVSGHLRGRTGSGDDFVMLQDSSVSGRTHVALLRGSDTFVSDAANDFGSRVWVGGILGRSDSISISDESTFDAHIRTPRFESHSVDEDVIDANVNDDTTGLLAIAENLRTDFSDFVGDETLTLTTSTDDNADTVESNETLITREDDFTITGTTLAGATVEVDADGDGAFDDATTTADSDGDYILSVALAEGAQTLDVRARSGTQTSAVSEVDVHRAIGSVARFTSNLGTFDVELLDSEAPVTVANFKDYFARYVDSVIHRSTTVATAGIEVIQGGGFVLNGDELEPVDTDAPIANEFLADNSNLRGTLAMALPANSPDGGTSQWFINVSDNANIDSGEYTVFGRVIGAGMDVVDAIHDLDIFDLNSVYDNDAGALSTVPLQDYVSLSETISGTVTGTSGSTSLIGTGTAFTTELEPGSTIQIGDVTTTVASIISDTELTLGTELTEDFTEQPLLTNAKPTADQLVVFDSIAEILPLT